MSPLFLLVLVLAPALPLPCFAEFTPLPADTPESTNSNFKTIDEEIRRIDSALSSTAAASGALAGNNTWTGSNTFALGSTFQGASTFTASAFMPWGRSVWATAVGSGTAKIMLGMPTDEISITDNATGAFTFTFLHPWTDPASFSCSCLSSESTAGVAGIVHCTEIYTSRTTSTIKLRFDNSANDAVDPDLMNIACTGY